MKDFKDKKILITGGSSGIGFGIAQALNNQGAHVLLVSSNPEKLSLSASEFNNEQYTLLPFDLNNVADIERFIEQEIVHKVGVLDGFVHSAGISDVRPIQMLKYQHAMKVMNINYFSFLEIVRVLAKAKNNSGQLNVVGISAIGAFLGNATKTAYCSSKAAMNAAVRCLAKELHPKSIRINTVAPGVTRTAMLDSFSETFGTTDEYNQIISRQYLGICEPEDIANAVLFLLSDQSRMITGSCISVDGGKLSS